MIGQPELAPTLESMGFDSLWVGDHVHFRVPTREALTVLAMMAAKTQRIRLGTAVLQTPMRHPFMLAKIVATIQEISGGRLTLGLGVGGDYKPEFDVLGVPTTERGARTDESLALIRALLIGGPVDFRGRFFAMENASLVPSVSPPPILIGGRTDAALKRTARYGDGYLPYLVSPEQVRSRLQRLADMLADEGRDPAEMTAGCNLLVMVSINDDEGRAFEATASHLARLYGMSFERIVQRYVIAGGRRRCEERILEYHDSGVDEFTFQLLGGEPNVHDTQFADAIAGLQSIVESVRRAVGGSRPRSTT
jgi:probable F420-dependent oxidoreductase